MRCRRGWLAGVWGGDGQTRCGVRWGWDGLGGGPGEGHGVTHYLH